MRFLHTADFQIGMKATHVGAAAEKVREQRLESVRRLVELAKGNGVEFIIVAGDLFEDNGIDRTQVLKLVDILEHFGGPVFIIPGNHDPLAPGSVWANSAWTNTPRIKVLDAERPEAIPNGLIYPCPIKDKYSTKDPTLWIPSESVEGVIRIGIAHGNLEGMPQAESDHRIARNAAERANLDYLALGHWHSTATYADTSGAVRTAYSGTPETSCFGERDSGNVLLVEIDSPGSAPKISVLHTGKYLWVTKPAEIISREDLVALRSDIEGLKGPGDILLNLSIKGVLHTDNISDLRRLEDVLKARFAYVQLDTEGLRPAPDDERWIESLPEGYIREAAANLRKIAASDRTDAPIAARALLELYMISSEVSQ
ncbi:MAG TPA: DNA repair exonuclease [Candidatus Aminicenantes bacterium]|nr:DNA repair exonuclease [Candidatus Aminicenantes bacterium]